MHPLTTIAQLLKITRPLVCLDVETTGKVKGIDRIIQIGVARTHPAVDGQWLEPREWCSFVDPQLPIPMEITHIHKISNEMVAGAPTWNTLAGMLIEGLSGCDFIGQNVKFDLEFIQAEFARVGHTWSYEGAAVIDTKRIDELKRPRTLAALVKEWLDLEITNAHEALSDVQWTGRVLEGQLTKCPDLQLENPQALHVLLWPRDPSWVDSYGRIVWRNSEAAFGFGKHNGWLLRRVPADYIRWVINKSDQPEEVKQILRNALAGHYPEKAIADQEAA